MGLSLDASLGWCSLGQSLRASLGPALMASIGALLGPLVAELLLGYLMHSPVVSLEAILGLVSLDALLEHPAGLSWAPSWAHIGALLRISLGLGCPALGGRQPWELPLLWDVRSFE